jgi:hypothetical protein
MKGSKLKLRKKAIMASCATAVVGAALLVSPMAFAEEQEAQGAEKVVEQAGDNDVQGIIDELDAEGARLDAELKAAGLVDGQEGAGEDGVVQAQETIPCVKYLKKNHRYQSRYIFNTDGAGRPNTGNANNLSIKTAPRSKCEGTVGGWGGKDFHGGHLIAATLNGPSNRANLVPMHKSVNLGAMKVMENIVKSCIRRHPGGATSWHATADYPNGSTVVPDRIRVTIYTRAAKSKSVGTITMNVPNRQIARGPLTKINKDLRAQARRADC